MAPSDEQSTALSLRPDDRDALRCGLRTVRRSAALPIVFGGLVSEGRLRLTDLLGVRTSGLHDLEVRPGAGLGGQVVVSRRPGGVDDYGEAATITHDYDRAVLGEGIVSVVAVPVLVGTTCRAVVYGAVRERVPLGARTADLMIATATRIGAELAVRDEVDRRLEMARALTAYAELLSISGGVNDEAIKHRLRHVAAQLALLGQAPFDHATAVRLSEREIDVLAQVALGCSNDETAIRLSLATSTVKAYLKSAMRKLDARTRHEAVVQARSLLLLP